MTLGAAILAMIIGLTNPANHPVPPTAPPATMWHKGDCADILLRPVPCDDTGTDRDADGRHRSQLRDLRRTVAGRHGREPGHVR